MTADQSFCECSFVSETTVYGHPPKPVLARKRPSVFPSELLSPSATASSGQVPQPYANYLSGASLDDSSIKFDNTIVFPDSKTVAVTEIIKEPRVLGRVYGVILQRR